MIIDCEPYPGPTDWDDHFFFPFEWSADTHKDIFGRIIEDTKKYLFYRGPLDELKSYGWDIEEAKNAYLDRPHLLKDGTRVGTIVEWSTDLSGKYQLTEVMLKVVLK